MNYETVLYQFINYKFKYYYSYHCLHIDIMNYKIFRMFNWLFNFNLCMEEFALQTIIVNQDNNSYYLDIGHGIDTKDVNFLKCGENKFVYKTIRE